jgi:signal transduction histidine kinase
MFSTHWREHHEPSERELRFLDLLGRQAADLIERSHMLEALRASERHLREADRLKDEFLAVLAHELRNPLVPIRNGVELLKRVREHPLIEQVRPMMELQRELVTVTGLVESAVEANRGAIDAAGLELEIDLKHPECFFEVDPTRLSQVISNVLHNATKFTPQVARSRCEQSWSLSALRNRK